MTLQQAIQNYGQAQFSLGVATLQLEQLLTPPTPEPEPTAMEEPK